MTRKAPQRIYRGWSARWNEELHCAEGVYVRRWWVETPWFSVRLHHWLHSDDDRNPHDHPWPFITFILKGNYTDVGDVFQRCSAGHFYYREATHKHWVRLESKDAWTLVMTGPKVRNWGLWVQGRFTRSAEYFRAWGRHICE